MILSMPNHVTSSVTRAQKHSRAGVSFKDTTSSTKYRGPLSVTFAIRLLRQNGGCLSTCALTQRKSCSECQKQFTTKRELDDHFIVHTKESNFMCGLCNHACRNNTLFEEHIRTHTREKPFACSECGMDFIRKKRPFPPHDHSRP